MISNQKTIRKSKMIMNFSSVDLLESHFKLKKQNGKCYWLKIKFMLSIQFSIANGSTSELLKELDFPANLWQVY